MKKYWKIPAIILATSMLVTGGLTLLSRDNAFQNNNQTSYNTNSSQLANAQTMAIGSNLEFTIQTSSLSNFAIARDAINGDRVYGWGKNIDGQLGTGDKLDKNVPTLIKGLPEKAHVKWIKGGQTFTLVVLQDNTVWATGSNQFGQFGNETIAVTGSTEFVKTISFPEEIKSFDVGYFHAAAIVGSAIYSWGRNEVGQLGVGDLLDKNKYTLVTTVIPGTLKEVKCGPYYTAILADSSNTLYICGNNTGGYLGVNGGSEILVPTVLVNPLPDTIVDFYTSGNANFPRIYVITDKNEVYAWGFGQYGALGITSTGIPTIIPLPADEQVVDAVFGEQFTTFRMVSGAVYTTGSLEYNGSGGALAAFTKIPTITNAKLLFGGGLSAFVMIDDQISVWGNNDAGNFGDGTNASSNTAIPINPFSTASSLTQIKPDGNKFSYVVANEIYDPATGFQEGIFDTYVKKNDFLPGATFSMSSAPIVNPLKGDEIICSLIAVNSYSQPDGALSVTPETFKITLTGFKVLPNSTIENKPLVADTIYNLNNIKNAMVLSNGTDVNMNTFNALFDTTNLPADNAFTVVASDIKDNVYEATLKATKFQFDGYVKEKNDIKISITGLVARPNSTVIQRAPSKADASAIIAALNPGEEIARDIISKMLDVNEFPKQTKFTVNTITSKDVDAGIIFSFTPDFVYEDGNAVANTKQFNVDIKFSTNPVSKNSEGNMWTVIALGISTGIVLLIFIGLLIYNLKSRRINGGYDGRSVPH